MTVVVKLSEVGSDLSNYLNSVKEIPVFPCPICPVQRKIQYVYFSAYTTRIVLVCGHSILKCSLCEFISTVAKDTKDHLQKIHPETLKVPCKFCEKKFPNNGLLGTHVKTAHPELLPKLRYDSGPITETAHVVYGFNYDGVSKRVRSRRVILR